MRIYISLLIIILSSSITIFGQNKRIDSLKQVLSISSGISKVDILNLLSDYTSKSPYTTGWVNRADSQKHYASIALTEAEKINYKKGIATALVNLSSSQWLYGIPLVQGNKDYSSVAKLGEDYALKALPITEQLKLSELTGDIYYNLSAFQYYLNNQELRYRLDNYKKASQYYKLAGNEAKENEAATWLCDQYMMLGQFEEGFQFCQRSAELAQSGMKYARTKEDINYRVFLVQQSLVNLASLHQQAGDYTPSLEYLRQSRHFGLNHNSTWTMYGEMGSVYLDMGRFDSSRYYHELQVNTTPKNDYSKYGLADLYVAVKEFDKAIDLLKSSLEAYRNGKSSARVLLPLAKAYNGKEQFREALNLARESFSKVNTLHKPQLMRHYKVLSDIHNNIGNHDSAFYYQTKYQEIKDAMLNRQFLWQLNNYKRAALDAKRSEQLALLERDNLIKDQKLAQQLLLQDQQQASISLLDRDNALKDKELLLKEQKLKQESLLKEQKQAQLALIDQQNKLKQQRLKQEVFLRNSIISGLALLVLLAVFIIRSLQLKRKNETLNLEKQLHIHKLESEQKQMELQKQALELETQALRAQMNPHFIFNCLSSINKFILKNESRIASDYLTRFSRLIRMVLTNSQLSMIPLSDEVDMLRLYLDMERLRFSNSFDYNIVFSNAIEPESVYIPPMVLQPICENAIWHGLMHKDGQGKLNIQLYMVDQELNCTITDNGVGRAKAKELKSKSGDKQKSFGLKITTERLALFNNDKSSASYQVEDLKDENGNNTGTRVTLKIKPKPIVKQQFSESV